MWAPQVPSGVSIVPSAPDRHEHRGTSTGSGKHESQSEPPMKTRLHSGPAVNARLQHGAAATQPIACVNRRDATNAEVRFNGFLSAPFAPRRLNRAPSPLRDRLTSVRDQCAGDAPVSPKRHNRQRLRLGAGPPNSPPVEPLLPAPPDNVAAAPVAQTVHRCGGRKRRRAAAQYTQAAA
jgi:hypothetical protein